MSFSLALTLILTCSEDVELSSLAEEGRVILGLKGQAG